MSHGASVILHPLSLHSEAVPQTGPTWTAVKVPGRGFGLMGRSSAGSHGGDAAFLTGSPPRARGCCWLVMCPVTDEPRSGRVTKVVAGLPHRGVRLPVWNERVLGGRVT